jgi:hypothetical protein
MQRPAMYMGMFLLGGTVFTNLVQVSAGGSHMHLIRDTCTCALHLRPLHSRRTLQHVPLKVGRTRLH